MKPSPRIVAIVTGVALVAGGCSGGEAGAPEAELTTATREVATTAPVGLTAPPTVPTLPTGARPAAPTEPQPAVAAAEVPETVEVHQPDVLVRTGPLPLQRVRQARKVEGIRAMSGTSRFEVQLRPPEGEAATLSALAIDPSGFRPLTPEVTAQTPGVWERMAEGEIVLRHDVAHDLGIELGETIDLGGPDGSVTVRVGAFASNGAPPVADLLVPWALGRQLGAPDVNLLVVATADGEARDVGERLVEAVGGEAELRDAPQQRQARVVGSPVDFEPFSYTELGDGMIVIDPAWVQRWIVRVELPRVGATRVHRLMAPQLFAALAEIEAAGLLGHFKPEQFGGGWVPRHIDWNPSKPLSMHAWGLAIDFNTHDNWLGETPQMDRRIVDIFERWGFAWGGHWSRPDGMHFELERVVTVDG